MPGNTPESATGHHKLRLNTGTFSQCCGWPHASLYAAASRSASGEAPGERKTSTIIFSVVMRKSAPRRYALNRLFPIGRPSSRTPGARVAAQTAAHADAMPMTIDNVTPRLRKRVAVGDITDRRSLAVGRADGHSNYGNRSAGAVQCSGGL